MRAIVAPAPPRDIPESARSPSGFAFVSGERVACRSGRGRAAICARPVGGNRYLPSVDRSAAAADAEDRMVRRGLGRPSRSFDATPAPAERVRRQKMPAAVSASTGCQPVEPHFMRNFPHARDATTRSFRPDKASLVQWPKRPLRFQNLRSALQIQLSRAATEHPTRIRGPQTITTTPSNE